MVKLRFEIVSDKEQAKKLWETFSPHKVIDDEWEFRNIWTEQYDFPFHFIVGYEGDKAVGLLPLQLNMVKGLAPKLLEMDKPFLEFFAGIDTDDNKVFLLPGYEQFEEEFYKQISSPAILTSLLSPITVGTFSASHYVDRFEIDLKPLPDFETFLQVQFDGKGRQRLINRLNGFEREYTVEIKPEIQENLDLMFQFSIQRFGGRSSFNMPDRQHIYREFLKELTVDLVTIYLNGEPKAVSFCLVHNKSYISLNIGYDYSIRDLSKLVVVTQIKRAMELGCTRFDAGQGNNGWKEHFHLTKIPQYKLVLP